MLRFAILSVLFVSVIALADIYLREAEFRRKYHYIPQWKNWYQAHDYCKRTGRELWTINSDEEFYKSTGQIRGMIDTEVCIWTSGTDLGERGTWVWMSSGEKISQASMIFVYSLSEGHCLSLDANSLSFQHGECTEQCYFICETNPKINFQGISFPANDTS